MSERRTELELREVEELPLWEPEEGVLYLDAKRETALHRCPCGCGSILPLAVAPVQGGRNWGLTVTDGKVTITPSISCVGQDCRSHYFITDNKVVWC